MSDPSESNIDPRGAYRLISSLLLQAISDMQRRPIKRSEKGATKIQRATFKRQYHLEQRDRIQSTIWLASSRATSWFDLANIDQAAALDRIDWINEAEILLTNPPIPLEHDDRKFLQDSVDTLKIPKKE